MNHLRTSICLLIIIGYRYRIELCGRIVSTQNTAWILPCNGRASLYLCPGKFTVHPFAVTSFGYKVIHTTFTFSITRIPVLHSRIFHFRTVKHHDFHNCRVQLVFITHRCRTSFQVRDITVIICNNQRTFKLSGIGRIDTEVRRQLHRTANPLRNIHKRTITKHSRVQCGKEIITIAHYRT